MSGIAGAGNWIVDTIKITDGWPNRGELVTILEERTGGGGAPFNVLTDLHKLGCGVPLHGVGCIGDDTHGRFVIDHCDANQIEHSQIRVIPETVTSYTDVFTVRGSGERTFFHRRGANALFSPEHVNIEELRAHGVGLFHFGYLLLLDAMDASDEEYGTRAAGLLKRVRDSGIQTSVDVVSEASDRFQRIVRPALPHTDHCIINEIEAGQVTGLPIRKSDVSVVPEDALKAAAALLELGVNQTVVIHYPEGAVWIDARGRSAVAHSLTVDPKMIVSSVGAGDAFCAGVLLGIHEGWTPEQALELGVLSAASSLLAASATGGVQSVEEMRANPALIAAGKQTS
mgnify:CR=1 FL=1